MRNLFQSQGQILPIVFRLGLLIALIILIPAAIYGTGRAGSSGQSALAAGAANPAPPTADLSLRAAVSPGPFYAGSIIKFTLTVNNLGPDTADSVVLTDTVPAGMTVISVTSTSGSCIASSQVTCSLRSIQKNTANTVTLIASAGSNSAAAANTAKVSTTVVDPDLTNNSASQTFEILPAADLATRLSASENLLLHQAQIIYRVVVTNLGHSPATNVVLIDTLPTHVSLVSSSPKGVCLGTQSLACHLGTLAPNTNKQVMITVAAHVFGNIANSVKASAAEFDPTISNNATQAVVDLRVEQFFLPMLSR